MASKVKTVTVIVERVSVQTPLFISNVLKLRDKVICFHNFETGRLSGTSYFPKEVAEVDDDFYVIKCILTSFHLEMVLYRIKMRKKFSKHVEFLKKGFFVLASWGVLLTEVLRDKSKHHELAILLAFPQTRTHLPVHNQPGRLGSSHLICIKS